MATKFLLPVPVNNPSYASESCHSFKLPPLDCSLTLPEIYDWHLVHNPRHTLFKYESYPDGYTHLSYAEVVPAAHRAARYVASAIEVDIDQVALDMPPVGIIATSDTITHFCTLVGMMKAGIPSFAISPHNSPASLAYILKTMNSSHVFISVERSIRQLVDAACQILQKDAPLVSIKVSAMPKYEEIFYRGACDSLKPRCYDLDLPVLYTHSSGSTSLPKLIPWTHRFLLQCGVAPHFGAHNYCNEIFAYHSASLSRGTGVHLLPWIPLTGMIVGTFPPASPAQFPSPAATFQGFASLGADYLITYPSLIETWSRDPEKVEALKNAKGIIYVGSPLNKVIGDFLAEKGVVLYSLFGMSEAGIVSTFFPPNQGMDWEYFTLTPHSGGEFVDAGDGLYELVIVKKSIKHIPLVNSKFGDADAYATRDLFIEHPKKPGYWRIVGRVDDLVVYSTGEKTNPIPLEHILARHPQVQAVIIFGTGQLRSGVLVQLHKEFAFDPKDKKKIEEFQEHFWPNLKEANATAPTHGQIFPEMILISSSSKPFFYTDKGSVKRGPTLALYKPEIDELYEAAEDTVQSNVVLPKDWSFENTLPFVRSAIGSVVPDVGDTDDIFHHGCDSLQATRIENIIRHALKNTVSGFVVNESLRNFIYEHPTPFAVAHFLVTITHQNDATEEIPDAVRRVRAMDAQATRFGTNFAAHTPPEDSRVDKGVVAGSSAVIVTGTTGHLGANILAQLAADDSVSHIYVLNRRSRPGVSFVDKQKIALSERGLDPDITTSSKVTMLEADFDVPGFCVDAGIINQMQQTVTHIYHLAWPVNWNLSLSSFDDMLGGVRNLIDLALSSRLSKPPRLLFASSIGVFRNITKGDTFSEQPLKDLVVATGQGYSEAKATVERILEMAAMQTSLRPIIVRLGQVSGGLNGAWNASDWVPALIKSSVAMGSLPDIQGVASWISAEVAAKAFIQIRDSDTMVIHLSHPRPIPLSSILKEVGRELDLPLIPYKQWLAALEKVAATNVVGDLNRLPALKMMDFWREGDVDPARSDVEVLGLPCLDVSNGVESSSALAMAPALNGDDVKQWLGYWKRISFL